MHDSSVLFCRGVEEPMMIGGISVHNFISTILALPGYGYNLYYRLIIKHDLVQHESYPFIVSGEFED
jgi:hypothetical protein